jgi:hypothetical protein
MGGGKSSNSSSTTYTERPLSEEELALLRSAKDNADSNTRIAEEAESRSQEQYNRYKEVYAKAEDDYIKKVNETDFGTPDKRIEETLRAGAKQASNQGEAQARRTANRDISARGISQNSGIAVAQQMGLSQTQMETSAQGQNEALFKAIQYGDTIKQNKLGNLGSIVGMGSQSFGGGINYQSNAMTGNSSSANINNSTFDSWNKRFQQNSKSSSSSWNANFGLG